MADEWLRAAQVAAMRERSVGGWREESWDWEQQDLVALADQDGRWRALVGRYLGQHEDYWHRVQAKAPSLKADWPSCPCDLCRDAQAALDGTPPPTRGAAE